MRSLAALSMTPQKNPPLDPKSSGLRTHVYMRYIPIFLNCHSGMVRMMSMM
jgi:hypothetical protein